MLRRPTLKIIRDAHMDNLFADSDLIFVCFASFLDRHDMPLYRILLGATVVRQNHDEFGLIGQFFAPSLLVSLVSFWIATRFGGPSLALGICTV